MTAHCGLGAPPRLLARAATLLLALSSLASAQVLLVQFNPTTGTHYQRDAMMPTFCHPALVCGPIQWGDSFAGNSAGVSILPMMWGNSALESSSYFINFTVSGNPTTSFAVTNVYFDR